MGYVRHRGCKNKCYNPHNAPPVWLQDSRIKGRIRYQGLLLTQS